MGLLSDVVPRRVGVGYGSDDLSSDRVPPRRGEPGGSYGVPRRGVPTSGRCGCNPGRSDLGVGRVKDRRVGSPERLRRSCGRDEPEIGSLGSSVGQERRSCLRGIVVPGA